MARRSTWRRSKEMNRRLFAFIALSIIAVAGCSSESSSVAGKIPRVQSLTSVYNRVARELGRPPKDEQEFKEKVKNSDINLEALNVGTVDELFISDRDGQPLGVVYGAP